MMRVTSKEFSRQTTCWREARVSTRHINSVHYTEAEYMRFNILHEIYQ